MLRLFKPSTVKTDYKVSRDNIFVGEVVKPSGIYRYADDYKGFMGEEDKAGKLHVGSWFAYRSILFTPNEQNLAQDLLYDSPHYPILNITDDGDCMVSEVVIKDIYKLDQLLEYFKYNEELSLEDLKAIRKRFFSGNFGLDNCELFGYKEDQPEDWTYFDNEGKEVIDPEKRAEYIMQNKRLQKMGHRSFSSGIQDHPLPSNMMNIFDELGDNNIYDLMKGYAEKINAFDPHKEEGPIKKLSKF